MPYDYNSELLKKHDLFEGERPALSQEEYNALRQNAMKKRSLQEKFPKGVNVAPGASKTSLKKDIDVAEYKRLVDRAKSGETPGRGAMQGVEKNKKSFFDQNGRRVDFIETKSGSLSIQFFFNDEDRLGIMYEAIYKKFGNSDEIIPKEYARSVDILSALNSINIYLPPQKFAFGFKSYLMREIAALVK